MIAIAEACQQTLPLAAASQLHPNVWLMRCMTPARVPDGIRKPPQVERISMLLWRCHSALLMARSWQASAAWSIRCAAAASSAAMGGRMIVVDIGLAPLSAMASLVFAHR